MPSRPVPTNNPDPETKMTIRLYDTAAREKRVFTPQDPKRVTMYVCGPTVYNYAHIGNARPPIVFDVLRRLLNPMGTTDAIEFLISKLKQTKSNAEFFDSMNA